MMHHRTGLWRIGLGRQTAYFAETRRTGPENCGPLDLSLGWTVYQSELQKYVLDPHIKLERKWSMFTLLCAFLDCEIEICELSQNLLFIVLM